MTREEAFARYLVAVAVVAVLGSQCIGCCREYNKWSTLDRAADRGAAVTMESDRISVLPSPRGGQ